MSGVAPLERNTAVPDAAPDKDTTTESSGSAVAGLAAAPEPLASIASVLADTGMRPEECYRLRWDAITWANGRNGTLLVTHGQTAAARRLLPITPRVRIILESQWKN